MIAAMIFFITVILSSKLTSVILSNKEKKNKRIRQEAYFSNVITDERIINWLNIMLGLFCNCKR